MPLVWTGVNLGWPLGPQGRRGALLDGVPRLRVGGSPFGLPGPGQVPEVRE